MAYRLFLFVLTAGLALGLLSARWLIELRPFTTIAESGWYTVPTLGDLDATPYVKAYRAKHALMPTTGSDTLIFTASRDSEGARLISACTYEIRGKVTTAGWWTLHSTTSEDLGDMRQTESRINSLTSVQSADGELLVLASAETRPNNWLATPPGRFEIVLTFYDAPFAKDALNGRMSMPTITRVDC